MGGGKWGDTRLICNKLWGTTPGLEGQGVSKGLQPGSLSQAHDPSVQPKSYGYEPATPGADAVHRETPERHSRGYSLKKAAQPTAQLKCLHTNARSTGNKQEELEATVLLERYDIVAITETWWDESHNWSVAIKGYKLFRRDRRGRRGGGVALYVKEWIESEEMSLKPSLMSDERVESLWVRIKGQANMRDTVVGIYYRPPDQDGEVDEIFYNQLRVASQSQALVLVRDFNYPDICWKGYTARNIQSKRFFQCIDDNFLTQLVEEPTRREALMDVVLANKEGLVEDSKVEGNLGCSDRGKIEFRIVGSMHKTISRTETLVFKRANFVLFKKLLGEIPWARALEGAMVTEDAGKAEVLNAFFASVFTAQVTPQDPWTLEESEEVWTKEDLPLVEEGQVRDQLRRLDIHKSMGPDGIHPRVLRKLAEVIAGPLSIIFERSWRTGEVPED
ncbi:adaptin ear-binding coat-associated protein 1 [Limosa lapponica baueri]|uniref:Adaptin ear-binding coat-associated protein 1 n=1 Tax=Limosa lapponica baueri TaxID=1758121 RepID=A0A2I0U5S1_LIMLA|nr:adaptin ear-binding coat-associated protein 1 [Limosa lapponica baueri]